MVNASKRSRPILAVNVLLALVSGLLLVQLGYELAFEGEPTAQPDARIHVAEPQSAAPWTRGATAIRGALAILGGSQEIGSARPGLAADSVRAADQRVGVMLAPGRNVAPRTLGEAAPAGESGARAPATRAPGVGGSLAPTREPSTSYDSIAARSVFSPTRTERSAVSAPLAVGPKPLLHGVVLRDDAAAIAFLEDPATKRVFAYRVGDAVARGTLESISTDHVVLRRGDGLIDVRLRDPSKPRAPVAAPEGAAGPAMSVGEAGSSPTGPPPTVTVQPLQPSSEIATSPAVPRPEMPGGVPPRPSPPRPPMRPHVHAPRVH